MIVNGYKITPAPVEYLPFRAYVEYEEGATERYMFLDESPARYAAKDAGVLGEAACAYLAWHEQKEAEG